MERQTEEISVELLERELERERNRRRRAVRRRCWFFALAALLLLGAAVLVLTQPILRISGDSMADTLRDGDLILGLRLREYRSGDVIGFRYDDGVLIKRLIAQAGDWVELDDEGKVFVNGAFVREPYVAEPDRGNCDVGFPITVPEGRCFVLGDNRPISIDSRSTALGCIPTETVLGRVVWRLWPLDRFGLVR